MSQAFKILLLTTSVLLMASCGPKGNEPNVELIQDMMEQEAVKAQRFDDFFADGISSRVPPANTMPIGFSAYRYEKDPDVASKELRNPFAGMNSDEVLLTGQNFYNTNCMVCHGAKGAGDGPLKGVFPLPIPSLLSDKVKNWPDGHIYHVATMGQGTMGPYRSQVPAASRWQLVSYIRNLQGKTTVASLDANATKKPAATTKSKGK